MRNSIYFQNLKRFSTHLFSKNKQERYFAKLCIRSYLTRIFHKDKECFTIKLFPSYRKGKIHRFYELCGYLLKHFLLWFSRYTQSIPPKQETILFMLYGIPKPYWEKELKVCNTELLTDFLDKNDFYIQLSVLEENHYQTFFCRKK